MTNKSTIGEIKKTIEEAVGKTITLQTNTGKRRSSTKVGVVEYVYPSLFTIRVTDGFNTNRRISYTYTDVLTESVLITFNTDEAV